PRVGVEDQLVHDPGHGLLGSLERREIGLFEDHGDSAPAPDLDVIVVADDLLLKAELGVLADLIEQRLEPGAAAIREPDHEVLDHRLASDVHQLAKDYVVDAKRLATYQLRYNASQRVVRPLVQHAREPHPASARAREIDDLTQLFERQPLAKHHQPGVGLVIR